MVRIVESLSSVYPAIAETVPRTRRELASVAASAGASPEQVDRVRLAVSETVTNVVEHAYAGEEGLVHVTAVASGGRLSILVADDGCGMGGSREHSGLGMGLSLAAGVCDAFTLAKRSTGGVEVRMLFALSAEEASAAHALDASRLADARAAHEVADAVRR